EAGSTGIVSVAAGKTLTANTSMINGSLGATLLKTGAGTLNEAVSPGVISVQTWWIVAEGNFICSASGNIFGGHATTTTNHVIDVRENAMFQMSVNAHAPIGRLELTGGTFSCPNGGGWSAPTANTALKGGVYVHASSVPSHIYFQAGAYLNHGDGNTQTVFHVESGAELHVEGGLYDGKDTAGTRRPTRLIKEGDGSLFLRRAPSEYAFTGGLELRGGTVIACSNGSLGNGVLDVTGTSGLTVLEEIEVAITGITGNGTLTLSGPGAVLLPTYASFSGFPLTCNGAILGFADFADSVAAAHTAYPTAGLLNTAAQTTIPSLSLTGDVTIGSSAGTTLTIGSLADADTVTIAGHGTTRINSTDAPISVLAGATAFLSSGATVTQNDGQVYFGDSDTATISNLTFNGIDKTLEVPEGKTVTVTSISGTANAELCDFHKTGAGTLIWPAVVATDFLRNIYVDEGTLSISSASGLGRDNLYLNGGDLIVTKGMTLSGAPLKLLKNATVSVSSGVTLSAGGGKLVASNHVLTKTGTGTISISGNTHADYFTNARVVIEEGTFFAGGDAWGGHTSNPSVVVEVHEQGTFHSNGHLPAPRVVMRGGLMYNNSRLSNGESHSQWMGFSLRHSFTVLPSTNGAPSILKADRCYMGQGNFIPVFDIAEGATLCAETIFQYGYGDTTATRSSGSFVKNGKGTMVLCDDVSCNNGTITVTDGTLLVKRECRIDPDATLETSGNARVELEDGAVLSCATRAVPAVVGTADIWIDACRTGGRNGAALDEIPNLGSAGGSFRPFTVGTIPDKPTFTINGIAGKSSFVFNGNQLLQLNSYTNKTQNLTIFGVAKRTTWKDSGGNGKWAGWLSLSTTAATGDDYTTVGAFQYQDVAELNQTIARNPRNFTLNGTSATGVAYLNFFEDAYTNRTASQYNENGVFVSTVDNANGGNFNIDVVAVGGRLTTGGKAIYAGTNNGNNRNFIGQVGEILVFSRVLTETEKADVNAYLKQKWFGVAPEGGLSDASLAISVPEGTASVASVPDGLIKTGEGTLQLGDASAAKSALVDAGTLALLPTTVVSRVAVWMDAADENTVTVEDGKVTSVRNKGTAGGEFTQAIPSGNRVANYPTLSPDINGRNCLVFDGNSALTLRDYVNTNDDWRISIYFVAKRSAAADLTASGSGKGRWGGTFSMSTVKATTTDNGMRNAIHIEEYVPDGTVTSAVLFVADKTTIKTATLESEVPYLFLIEVGVYSHSFGIEKKDSAMQFFAESYTQPNNSPIFDIDLVQLGGRLGANGAPQWVGAGNTSNRMWLGSLGEFLVFDRQLSDDEHVAVVNYLKAKWLTENATYTVPGVLTGETLAPAFSANTALTLEENSTLLSAAATQPLASFTANGAATLARDGVTAPADYALFDVAGDVEMPGNMAFRALSIPDNSAAMIRYAGELNTTATSWTLDADIPGVNISYAHEGEIRLLRATGTILFLR
ncbi:MAG: hypothetical protein IKR48_10350, partial [Kiritimatiellae bacterium]|nr:hypothetical protein [Kiritimatiellia bacterium]